MPLQLHDGIVSEENVKYIQLYTKIMGRPGEKGKNKGISHKRVYPVTFLTKSEVEYVHNKQYIFCGFDASSGLIKTSGRYLNRECREGTHILTRQISPL